MMKERPSALGSSRHKALVFMLLLVTAFIAYLMVFAGHDAGAEAEGGGDSAARARGAPDTSDEHRENGARSGFGPGDMAIHVEPLEAQDRAASSTLLDGPISDRGITITVVDSDLASVEGAEVGVYELSWDSRSDRRDAPNRLYTTDVQGQVVIKESEVPSGHFVIAKRGELESSRQIRMSFSDVPFKDSLRLDLERLGVIDGIVLDATGMPVMSAQLTIHEDGDPIEVFPVWDPQAARTGIDGKFRLPVSPGMFECAATQGSMSSALQLIHVSAGSVTESTFVIGDRFIIEGTVKQNSGKGVPLGGSISASNQDLNESLESSVDSTGHFRIAVGTPGCYDLRADVARLVQSASVSLNIAPPTTYYNVTISLDTPATIRGRTIWSDGEVAEDKFLWMHKAYDRANACGRTDYGSVALARSDSRGEFIAAGLVPNELYAITPGGETDGKSTVFVMSGATGVDMVFPARLKKRVMLRGEVLDAESGASISQYDIKVKGFGDAKVAKDKEGIGFEVDGLYVGEEYWLTIRAAGHNDAVVGPLVGSDAMADLHVSLHSGRRDVTVQVFGSVEIRAEVEAALIPVGAMRDRTVPLSGVYSMKRRGPGELEFRGVAPGEFWLSVVSGKSGFGPKLVSITDSHEFVAAPMTESMSSMLAVTVIGNLDNRRGNDVFVCPALEKFSWESRNVVRIEDDGSSILQPLRAGIYGVGYGRPNGTCGIYKLVVIEESSPCISVEISPQVAN